MHLTNEQLEVILTGCNNNDRRVQKELYSNYYSFAMSIAVRYANNYDNAVEMVNDGFLKIFKDLKKFVPKYENAVASFTAWLKRLIINSCIDHIRKYSAKEKMASVEVETIVYVDEKQNAEQIIQNKEIIKCIQLLSPAYKTVFNLYVIEGFSHDEIATMLNISEGTSKSNLFKARQNLQSLLVKSNIENYE